MADVIGSGVMSLPAARHAAFAFAAAALGALGLGGAAQATPLTVVSVAQTDLNCVFNVTCHVTATDTVARFPPKPGYSGHPRLNTRTFEGAPGSQAEGLTGYLYQVDFTKAFKETDINCVVWLKLKFGPVRRLSYDGGARADVFVITSEATGSIGISSAEKTGGSVTLTFTEPVCPTSGAPPGQESFWVGMSSSGAPVSSRAQADLTFGGGVVAVRTRTPALH
jgi:hypothetical protein